MTCSNPQLDPSEKNPGAEPGVQGAPRLPSGPLTANGGKSVSVFLTQDPTGAMALRAQSQMHVKSFCLSWHVLSWRYRNPAEPLTCCRSFENREGRVGGGRSAADGDRHQLVGVSSKIMRELLAHRRGSCIDSHRPISVDNPGDIAQTVRFYSPCDILRGISSLID